MSAISIAEINPSSLPWLPLERRSQFPQQPVVYFVIDSDGTVQYIGQSRNLKRRWQTHHCYKELSAMRGVRVAYLFMSKELLPGTEEDLIKRFKPPLNKVVSPLENLKLSPRSGRPAKYGKRTNHKAVVSDIGWEGSQSVAKMAGFSSVSEMLEELGRGNVTITPKQEISRDTEDIE